MIRPDSISPSRIQTQLSTVARGCHEWGWRVPIIRQRLRTPQQNPDPGYIMAWWDYVAVGDSHTLPEPEVVPLRVARSYAASDVLPLVERGQTVAVSTGEWSIAIVPTLLFQQITG